jgi:hypothetical protein
MKKHPYYVFDKIRSYNGTYNFLVGGRGLGKTYGAKKKAIKDALEKGDEFIYVRRYKNELTVAKSTFFADLLHEFPKYDFKVSGSYALAAPANTRDEKKRDWVIIGYFVALSTSQNQKSVSYPKVKTIIYDEFIIETGMLHYLPNESVVFNNFYSTVDRSQDKTRVYFLANSVSIMNPYFIAYDITPEKITEFMLLYKNATTGRHFVVCHFPNSDAFATSVYETDFGQFIKGTEYAEYAVGNAFSDNNDSLLDTKDSKSRYLFTLECKNGMFSVWFNMFTSAYFVQSKLPKAQEIYTMIPTKMTTDKILMNFSDRPLAYLRSAFKQGTVSFDTANTRNTFSEIFKR